MWIAGEKVSMSKKDGKRKQDKTLKDAVGGLQYGLGEIDLFTTPSDPGVIRFLVVVLQPIKIKMDGNLNHKRPHLHIDYGPDFHTASYAIDNGERLAGTLATKYDRKVKDWIASNRPKLLQAWNETQAGKYPEKIICELRGNV
jgi:uncharacterized protein DUF4160